MKRIVSVYLPRWPIERMATCLRHHGQRHTGGHPYEHPQRDPRQHKPDPRRRDERQTLATLPFALVEAGHRGVRLSAVNAPAETLGLKAGDALADARAILPTLATGEAQPAADRAGLRAIAWWLGRYGLARNAYGIRSEAASGHLIRAYGLWVDIAGVAHLFGGEGALLADLATRLNGFGLTAQLGLADTLGAAHALAWSGEDYPTSVSRIAKPNQSLAAIAHLPVASLRLDTRRVHLLHRLGLKTIGALTRVPRSALERRFGGSSESEHVLMRLDQALGVRVEPRRPLIEVPALSVRQTFAEPLISADPLEHAVKALVSSLCLRLEASGQGARHVRLALFRSDGSVAETYLRVARPTRNPTHLIGLLREKLTTLDLGFGVDVLTLDALHSEALKDQQGGLSEVQQEAALAARAVLIDRLVNRLGAAFVSQIVLRPSHWPEHAESRVGAISASAERSPHVLPRPSKPQRPSILLAPPEPIDVIAVVPEGAPVRFIWRRVRHRIVRAQGPERIEPEWWREIGAPQQTRSRDYYALEDETGGRFWVFRAERYMAADEMVGDNDGRPYAARSTPADATEQVPPKWFVHGLFC